MGRIIRNTTTFRSFGISQECSRIVARVDMRAMLRRLHLQCQCMLAHALDRAGVKRRVLVAVGVPVSVSTGHGTGYAAWSNGRCAVWPNAVRRPSSGVRA